MSLSSEKKTVANQLIQNISVAENATEAFSILSTTDEQKNSIPSRIPPNLCCLSQFNRQPSDGRRIINYRLYHVRLKGST